MVGKMILPLLGGTPAVWSTCMVFFQAVLLVGYAYAHASTAWLGARRQAALHVVMLVLPLSVLPLAVDPARLRGGEANPVLDVLLLLSLSVGLPFLVVSATAPLLQKWFTHTGHPAARDPYFLYAASNFGSMLALLGYPTLIEPRLHLRGAGWLSQTGLWSLAYLVFAGLVALCALMLWRGVSARTAPASDASATVATPAATPSATPSTPIPSATMPEEMPPDAPAWSRRLRWVALAFVPSSLLLGVTTYITTDIAAVPLLWVIPLAIYLLTFILAFGRWPAGLHRAVVAVTLPVVLLVLFLIVSGTSLRIWVTVLWHLLLLLTVALACHGELALTRPSPAYLTGFYLLISVGGVLGGLFNALVAPAVFNSLLEYPLVMVLACMLIGARGRRPAAMDRKHALLFMLAWPLTVGALAFILYSELLTARLDFAFVARLLNLKSEWTTEWLDPTQRLLNKVLIYGPPLVLSYLVRRRPLVMGLALAALLAVTGFVDKWNNEQIHQARSFFGALRITRDRDDKGYTELRHGTTLHGRQSLDPERRGEPLSYYHRQGPIGQVFAELDKRSDARRVAVIGLGTGTLAAYARTGDAMTFYEIDRLVRDIAFDRAYFTYVTDARDRGATLRVELGDARIRLDAVKRERPGERYDLIAVDAFTSDAIPVHLLTREAFQLYFEMLNPGGLLAVHISNRYLDLEPVVASLAADAALGGRLIQQEDAVEVKGAAESTWVVLARTPEALGGLGRDERWTREKLALDPRVGTWTDDFHNVLSVFKWR
jgi:SAM-dependent methyltransferase